jgi:ADP-heptose:LPS heptosyltransferase
MKNFFHRVIIKLIGSMRPVHAIDTGRIACIELSRLGDVMVMLPALRLLRANFRSSEIIVVVRQSYMELLRRMQIADEVIGIEGRNILGAIKTLRDRDITLACSMSPATTNALCALFGARASIGYLEPPRTLPGILDKSVVTGISAKIIRQEYFMENLYQRGVKICRALGFPDEPILPIEITDSVWERSSLDALRALDLAIHSPYIILHPLAGWEYRTWSVDRWRKLIEKIVRETHYKCILISSGNERDQLEKIAEGIPRVHYAAGVPLEHCAILMKRSWGFVGNDSGPLHLAASIGVPVIGLYGPAAPRFTAPTVGRNIFLFRQLECSPCSQRRCIRPEDSCMMQLDPDSVFDAIIKLFNTAHVQT